MTLNFPVFLSLLLLLGFFEGLAQAEVTDLNVTADLTYASKYMTDGFKIGGDNPVMEPSLKLDLFSSGFSLMSWSEIQLNRGNQQYDEFDLMALYSRTFFERKRYAINFHSYYDYWFYPKSNVTTVAEQYFDSAAPESMKGNKFHAGVTFPEAIPVGGSYLVPSYNVYYWLYWYQNKADQFEGGTHHELLLQYFHKVPRFIPGGKEHFAGVSGSANYNDGVFGVAPGWSHTIAQAIGGVYAAGGVFSLSVNRQWSYKASVDPQDEIWSTLSYTKKF